jgi:hypothetical protein
MGPCEENAATHSVKITVKIFGFLRKVKKEPESAARWSQIEI